MGGVERVARRIVPGVRYADDMIHITQRKLQKLVGQYTGRIGEAIQ